jgi:hypothetical protein
MLHEQRPDLKVEQSQRDAMVFGTQKGLTSVKIEVENDHVDKMLIDAINAKLAILNEIYI